MLSINASIQMKTVSSRFAKREKYGGLPSLRCLVERVTLARLVTHCGSGFTGIFSCCQSGVQGQGSKVSAVIGSQHVQSTFRSVRRAIGHSCLHDVTNHRMASSVMWICVAGQVWQCRSRLSDAFAPSCERWVRELRITARQSTWRDKSSHVKFSEAKLVCLMKVLWEEAWTNVDKYGRCSQVRWITVARRVWPRVFFSQSLFALSDCYILCVFFQIVLTYFVCVFFEYVWPGWARRGTNEHGGAAWMGRVDARRAIRWHP